MPKAFIIMDVDVTHPKQYAEYKKWSSLAMQAHNVKVLVRGGATHPLEGRKPGRSVVLEFPNWEAAENFYESHQYRRARNARENAAIMNMFIVQGV